MKEFKKAMVEAFPYTIPVLTGFLMLGAAYGMLMQAKGYGTVWAVLMSAIAFCGSMQFVAITLLTVAFNPIQAFLLSLMVNARHIFYGISMLEKYRGLGTVRLFLIYTLCDETFSICSGVSPRQGISRKYFYLAISLLNYIYWVFGTLFGGIAGQLMTFDTTGLDFVLTALFVVLFIEQVKKHEKRLHGLIGLLCTVACLVVFGADRFVIPAMLLILSVLLLRREKRCL
ncbi:MAG: AzlC family ABC transporter permease [Candidatus Fimivivens sp.]